MPDDRPASHPLPRLTKLGIGVIGFGLLFDLSEHSFPPDPSAIIVGGFPLAEHAAHLVVILGMVAVLVGIVVDGIRVSRGLDRGLERSHSNAHR